MIKLLKKRLLPLLLLTISVVAILIIKGILPYRIYVIHTGSMKPTIPPKSAVIVRVGQYKVGQPVTYVKSGQLITHRLMAINAGGTIDTKGDGNPTMDPWHVKTSAIVGGVIFAPRMVGYWLMYLKNPYGLASLADTAIVFWLIWDLVVVSETKPVTLAASTESSGRSVLATSTREHVQTVRSILVIDGLAMTTATRKQPQVSG